MTDRLAPPVPWWWRPAFHWACVAVVHDPRSRSRYEALRSRGHSYGRALRGVADGLLGLACVLLRRQVLFDPSHGAPIAA